MTADGPLSTAHLPRPDPARGVFETLLVVDGRPIELDAHLDRLAASVRELWGAPAMARVAGPAAALVRARANGTGELGRLRLTLAPDGDGTLDLSVVTATVDPETVFPAAEHGVALAPVAVPGGLGTHKWADRRLLERASRELAAHTPASETGHRAAASAALPLIVDGDGSVLEAERANLFAFQDEILTTPPLDGRILAGVARARVVEIARELGVDLRERPLTLADLDRADAVFLTGSVRGVEPVVAIAGATTSVDRLTARIAAALRERWLIDRPA